MKILKSLSTIRVQLGTRDLPDNGKGAENLTDKNEPIGLIIFFIWDIVAYSLLYKIQFKLFTIVYIIQSFWVGYSSGTTE